MILKVDFTLHFIIVLCLMVILVSTVLIINVSVNTKWGMVPLCYLSKGLQSLCSTIVKHSLSWTLSLAILPASMQDGSHQYSLVVLETAVLVSRPLETGFWQSWSWSWSRRCRSWSWSRRIGLEYFSRPVMHLAICRTFVFDHMLDQ